MKLSLIHIYAAVAREKMHNASCMAGMAFTNAFLGINHSLAHKLGGEYPISHGRANAILMPFVIEYNAQKPNKFSTWPKYETFVADQKYAEIAKALNLPCKTVEEGVKSLISCVYETGRLYHQALRPARVHRPDQDHPAPAGSG